GGSARGAGALKVLGRSTYNIPRLNKFASYHALRSLTLRSPFPTEVPAHDNIDTRVADLVNIADDGQDNVNLRISLLKCRHCAKQQPLCKSRRHSDRQPAARNCLADANPRSCLIEDFQDLDTVAIETCTFRSEPQGARRAYKEQNA